MSGILFDYPADVPVKAEGNVKFNWTNKFKYNININIYIYISKDL